MNETQRVEDDSSWMKKSRLKIFLLLLLVGTAVGLSPGPAIITQVEVIAPSMPVVDSYAPLTLVARAESGRIDRRFSGEVWLWTDGPYLRPFHLSFQPEDQGVIWTPARFSSLLLQRVEVYTLGGLVHSWSNPVWPVSANNAGPRLFWGMAGERLEPGLDFILTAKTREEVLAGVHLDPHRRNEPVVLVLWSQKIQDELWYFSPAPHLPAAEQAALRQDVEEVKTTSQLHQLATRHADKLLLFSTSLPLRTKIPGALLMWKAEDGKKEEQVRELDRSVQAVTASEGGLIGVWSTEQSEESIWLALKQGAVCGAWGSRIIMAVMPGSGESGLHVVVAGQGPRERIAVYKLKEGKKAEKIFFAETDADRLEFDLPGVSMRDEDSFLLLVTEPGSPRSSWAFRLFRPARSLR